MRQALGKNGEKYARAELEKRGYQIWAQNWRCALGEADIVACHQNQVVIIEVRTRYGESALENALASLTPRKQAKLEQIAQAYYAQAEREDLGLRIDFVAVGIMREGVQIEVYESAVSQS